MKKIGYLLAFSILFSAAVFSQNQAKAVVDLQKNSELTVHGSTNLLNFRLKQSGDKIMDKPLVITAKQNGNRIYLSENKLSIVVENFKSDNFIAQSEFYKLMQTEKYPKLHIEIDYFEMNRDEHGKIKGGNALLNINITGVNRKYVFPVTTGKDGDLIMATGKKKLTIRDFGLIPPVAMLGMVRVSEWIVIDFDIHCKVRFL